MKQPSHLLPAIATALCGAMWGVFWVPVRWFEDRGVGGGWISLIFCLVCMAAPLPWLLKREHWNGFRNEAFTGLLMGAGFTFYTVALVLTDVVTAILLFYLAPIWGSIATWVALRQSFTATRVIAIIAGFAGTGMILGAKTGFPFPQNTGDILAICAGILWSLGGLNSFLRPSKGAALSVFCFAGGGSLTSLLIVLAAGAMALPLAHTGGLVAAIPLMILTSLIIFVPPNFLVLWASQRLDPGRVGVLLMMEVLVGSISAAILAGESFGPWKFAGAALILTAGLIEVLSRPTVPHATR